MKAKPAKPHVLKRAHTDRFERMASEIAMEVWNQLTDLPKMHGLKPRDFPSFYEVICRSLKHYRYQSW